MRFQGTVWRHVPAGAHPLHVGFIVKAHGRWNRAGEYGCLYSSLSQVGARAELERHVARAALTARLAPRELVSLDVDIRSVVDLTDPSSSPVSVRSRFLTGDEAENLEACRSVADYLLLRMTDVEEQPFRSLGFVSVILVSGLYALGLPPLLRL